MSEPRILLCGPALDAEESAASLDMLRQVTFPNAVKFVVTTAKFDAQGVAKCVNVQSDYPAELALLETMLRWSEVGDRGDPRFRDAYDLYCLRRILARHKKGFDYAVVLRGAAANFDERWPELQRSIEGGLFLTFGDASGIDGASAQVRSFLVDLGDDRLGAFLEAAWQLFLTGAIYGLANYSLDTAFRIALDSVELGRSVQHADARPAADSEGGCTLADANDENLVDNQAE